MKKCLSLLVVLFFTSTVFPTDSWARWDDIPDADTWDAEITRKIIYPWHATTEIVKPGESFEVWFNADQGQTVESVQLKGPYNTVDCSSSIVEGDWEYDRLSGNRFNTRITVTVPSGTPDDRYDLVLKTSHGNEVSWGGVRVIKEYKDDYYIMHFSDAHVFQRAGVHDSKVILARKSAMIEMANIMNVSIIIETGDAMYNIVNNPEHELAFHLGVESENIKGNADANAATFITVGNHDAPGNDFNKGSVEENSDFWNKYWGLQNYSFKYGNGRFMITNNSWRRSDHEFQSHEAVEWLKNEGSGGNLFVSAAHLYGRMHDIIDDYQPLDMILAGHNHFLSHENPREFASGRDEVAYIAASVRDHFLFNLFRVNNNTGQFDPVPGSTAVAEALYSGDIDDRSTWEPNLTLTYANENDGSVTENTATIVNKFDFPILGARVRFVIPQGEDYEIGNGTIFQQFEGDSFQIVDVETDVPANSTKNVYLGKAP